MRKPYDELVILLLTILKYASYRFLLSRSDRIAGLFLPFKKVYGQTFFETESQKLFD